MSEWLPYEEVHGTNHTASGKVLVRPALDCPQLGGSRDILVYLPPSLAAAWPERAADRSPYPVLYFHDGQNIFDRRTSYAGEWQADETLELLAGEGLEAIAVGLPNGSQARMSEYSPWPDAEHSIAGRGDAYLEFLFETVKPYVDASFPTQAERAATVLVGSSLGGLISLYAASARPDVVGAVGALSPALWFANHRLFEQLERQPIPPRTRLYLDMGGREWPNGLADARRLRDRLIAGDLAATRDLHYVEERYAYHRESAWARRLPAALRFLLAGAT